MIEEDCPDYHIEASMLTDAGCHRAHNEDNILYVKPGEASLLKKKGVLAIVADGMGGHQAGEVASRIAIEAISNCYYQQKEEPLIALKKAVCEANTVIYTTARQQPHFTGMGTTGTVLAIWNGKAFIVNVGDSRIYRIRAGNIEQMTEDDTMINELIKGGMLRPENAEEHLAKNVITRAIGTHSKLDLNVRGPYPVEIGDSYILCSDGLHNLVTAEEIRIAVSSASPFAVCSQLVEMAKSRGGYDNISVGILNVLASQPPLRGQLSVTRYD